MSVEKIRNEMIVYVIILIVCIIILIVKRTIKKSIIIKNVLNYPIKSIAKKLFLPTTKGPPLFKRSFFHFTIFHYSESYFLTLFRVSNPPAKTAREDNPNTT